MNGVRVLITIFDDIELMNLYLGTTTLKNKSFDERVAPAPAPPPPPWHYSEYHGFTTVTIPDVLEHKVRTGKYALYCGTYPAEPEPKWSIAWQDVNPYGAITKASVWFYPYSEPPLEVHERIFVRVCDVPWAEYPEKIATANVCQCVIWLRSEGKLVLGTFYHMPLKEVTWEHLSQISVEQPSKDYHSFKLEINNATKEVVASLDDPIVVRDTLPLTFPPIRSVIIGIEVAPTLF